MRSERFLNVELRCIEDNQLRQLYVVVEAHYNIKMCSLVMQMAFPSNSTKRSHNSDNKSSKLSTNRISNACHRLRCSLQLNADQLPAAERRSGNYSPSRWDVDYIQSLHSDYKEERHRKRASYASEEDGGERNHPIRRLELIDELQRLGLSQHLQNEFKEILNSIYLDTTHDKSNMDLYSTALAFKLLRQHGYQVGQDVFDSFKNEEGEFKQSLIDDTRGMLQLYEASFLLTEVSSIRYSLDIPIHWRIERLNTSVWIDSYKKNPDMNPTVLELAILDSNIVQAQYQEELKQVLQSSRRSNWKDKRVSKQRRGWSSSHWLAPNTGDEHDRTEVGEGVEGRVDGGFEAVETGERGCVEGSLRSRDEDD
ncbi:hypothetical protein SASPL_115414 [Salvia splendens]|uniref:Terpene synthase N-terminal domain-containing protein n=1 Tax=Salvia splendens TaxID=180675 RepID=A0A8X9A241_SALSN|nr:hypothetical protein SASPL_115414 [Salvia splendens]